MSEQTVMLKASVSGKRAGTFNVQLGLRSSGKPWTVEINAPKAAADPNGLVSVATNEQGRRFVLRQVRLRPNPDSDGEVEGSRFRALRGLETVTFKGVASHIPRDRYVVADIDAGAEEIRRPTSSSSVERRGSSAARTADPGVGEVWCVSQAGNGCRA